jgi:hypothetical protein
VVAWWDILGLKDKIQTPFFMETEMSGGFRGLGNMNLKI